MSYKIIDNPSVTNVEKMIAFVKSKNKDAKNIEEIAKSFIEVGYKYGVRGDIAYCQAIIETGWFKFDGGTAVTYDQHNYCGLGVTKKGVKGVSFNTVKDGVTGMIQHLYAYASKNPIPNGENLLDPRFKYVTRGIAPTWNDLSNRWAMNPNYGKHIISIYEQLVQFVGQENVKGEEIMTKYIALSDGHGIDTAGKRTPILPNGEKSEIGRNYMNENLFNRAVVKYLDAELKRHGFKTLLVAPTDADTPLEIRTNLANKHKVDLYVSIHANASTGKWGNHGGIETFTSRYSESKRIGTLIHNELLKGSPLRDRGVKDGSHLWEIKKPDAPSVLVEAGFMDSHNDYKYLLSDAYRKECAIEIAKGICKAYNVTYKETTTSKPQEIDKEIISEAIKGVDDNMKMELSSSQWGQLASVFEEAFKSGILSDRKWWDKANNKDLTVSELIYLSLVLGDRYFKEFKKQMK